MYVFFKRTYLFLQFLFLKIPHTLNSRNEKKRFDGDDEEIGYKTSINEQQLLETFTSYLHAVILKVLYT